MACILVTAKFSVWEFHESLNSSSISFNFLCGRINRRMALSNIPVNPVHMIPTELENVTKFLSSRDVDMKKRENPKANRSILKTVC